MKKTLKIIIVLLVAIFISACSKKEYKVSDEVNLTGTVTNNETIINGEYSTKSILKLDDPIIIDGKSVTQIEIDYDKDLKDNSKVTISGVLSTSKTTSFGINVSDVAESESLVNTFSNSVFSVTIPTSLIKICTVSEITNGFIVYSTSNMDNGGEVFRIVSVSNKRFQELQNNSNAYIEKIASNQSNTVIIIYPTTNEYSEENYEEYETIGNSIESIKNNVRLN